MPVHPELQAQLDREAASGLPPRNERSVQLTRDLYVQSAKALARNIPLARVEDFQTAGVSCRLYARSADERRDGLVYFHGGRFFSGNLETHDTLCREIAATGLNVVAVDYRLAPEHPFPAGIEDCLAATQWVRENAPSLGIEKVAVGGDSAGACLAAVTALQEPRLAAQLLIYPMIDPSCSLPSHREFATGYGPGSIDMLRGWQEYLPPNKSPTDPLVTPLAATSLAGLPPACIVTAEYDTLRDEGEQYAARLEEAGNRVMLRNVPGAIHGFFQYTAFSGYARASVAAACAALRSLLVLS
jgi:acetyl esterase